VPRKFRDQVPPARVDKINNIMAADGEATPVRRKQAILVIASRPSAFGDKIKRGEVAEFTSVPEVFGMVVAPLQKRSCDETVTVLMAWFRVPLACGPCQKTNRGEDAQQLETAG
jgi:hypothetical protein